MKKITCGIALIAALTLLGAPLAAHATEETEVASSESTKVLEETLTEPILAPQEQVTLPTTGLTPAPTSETVTPPQAVPVVSPQPIVSEATSLTTVAPSSTSSTRPTTSPKYVLAVWENAAGSPKFPQTLVTSYMTDSPNVKVLAQYTKCGTFYQSDLYANDAQTAKLIAGGVLRGGDESWPKGEPQRYDTRITAPCVSVPLIQDYVKCEGAAFVLDNIGSNQDVRYLLSGEVKREFVVPGGTAIHTDSDGWLLKPGPQGYVITAGDRTWTFPAATCPVITPPTEEEPTSPSTPPTHDGPTTPDAPGTGSTGGGTAPLPTNTEVTPLVESPAAPSLHTALEATGTTEVLPTDKPATHSLAYTGPNEVNNIGAGIALVVILAGLLIVVLSRNRRP